jgi:hypothetical protein
MVEQGSIIDSSVLSTAAVLGCGGGEDGCRFARERAVEPARRSRQENT